MVNHYTTMADVELEAFDAAVARLGAKAQLRKNVRMGPMVGACAQAGR